MVSASRTTPKSRKSGSKKDSKTDHIKMHQFQCPVGPPRRRKVSKRAPQRDRKGSLREAESGKNCFREGPKIRLLSQVGPERAPRGSGGLHGVLFGNFYITLKGSPKNYKKPSPGGHPGLLGPSRGHLGQKVYFDTLSGIIFRGFGLP